MDAAATATTTAAYTVRYNRTSVHIEGLGSAGNYGPNAGMDLGEGYVRYDAYSHCPALTRGAIRMQPQTDTVVKRLGNGRVRRHSVVTTYSTAADALRAAEALAYSVRNKMCTKCAERAAQVAATEAPALTDAERAALVAERDQVAARLAEIDALLAR